MSNNSFNLFTFSFNYSTGIVERRNIGFHLLSSAYDFALEHNISWVKHTYCVAPGGGLKEEYIQLF